MTRILRIIKDIWTRMLLSGALLVLFTVGQAMACCCPGIAVTALEGMKNKPVIEGEYYQKHFAVRDISALEKGEISTQVGGTDNRSLPLTITLPNRYQGKHVRVVVNSVLNYVEPAKGQPFAPLSRFTVSLYRIEERDGIQTVKILDRDGGGVKTVKLGPKNFILKEFRPIEGERFRVSVVVKERGRDEKIVAAHTVSGRMSNQCGLQTYVMSKVRAAELQKRIKKQDGSGGWRVLVYQDNAPLRFKE